MQWIDENGLKRWATRTDARSLLIDMVSDLIKATIIDASRFRFPGGDVGQVRGFDGDLETEEEVYIIPAGKSKWEFGTGAGEAKATKDYAKRTKGATPTMMAENTLILVSLDTWDTPRTKLTEWEDARKAEKKWRDVLIIDGVILIHWLDKCPAVAARYAREILNSAPQEGVLSTDEYWDEYSSQFKPSLTEAFVIGDRSQAAHDLVEKLLGPAQSILLGAETTEEVIAFAVAAIRTSDSSKRAILESRTLIVQSESAARFLSQSTNLIFIVVDKAQPKAGLLSEKGPTLSPVTGAQVRQNTMLQRQSATSMAEGFETMGLDRNAGYDLAHQCGRSLTILKRLKPKATAQDPEWLPLLTALKPIFMAGGWCTSMPLDCEILKMLSGEVDYQNVEKSLFPTLALSDAPIDRIDDVWQVRSPVDAFHYYSNQVSAADLQKLRTAVITVFGHIVLSPPREQKFALEHDQKTNYSAWLRDGLALTLLIFAAMDKVGRLGIIGQTPQHYVDEIVSALPGWGKNHQILLNLGNQSALLAEAAPEPFLTALESILGESLIKVHEIFFYDEDFVFGPQSPHVALLWALETIAWIPKYLNRTCLIVAAMADLDSHPDRNLSNRPIETLRSILLGWSPNTYATLEQRIISVQHVLQKYPAVGWKLLIKLLPFPSDFSSPTQKPKLRDVQPRNFQDITDEIIGEFETAIVNMAIGAAADNESKIIELTKYLGILHPENRTKFLNFIDAFLTTHPTAEGNPVWHAIQAELSKHEYFTASDWALSKADRGQLVGLLDKHRPADPMAFDRRYFDEWTPHIGQYSEVDDNQEDPDNERLITLTRIVEREGLAGILRLAAIARQPDTIGPVISLLNLRKEQLLELLTGAIDSDSPGQLAFYVSATGEKLYTQEWHQIFADKILPTNLDKSIQARLLFGWPLDETTWDFVTKCSLENEYWSQIKSLPIRGTALQMVMAINKFRERDRSLEALCLLNIRAADIPSDVLLALLEESATCAYRERVVPANLFGNYLNYALKELRERKNVKEEELVRLEYMYYPFLVHGDQKLSIIKYLLKTPDFFVDVLSHVFRGKNEPQDIEISQEAKSRAQISFRVLSSIEQIPGFGGEKIDDRFLYSWVSDARIAAAGRDLTEIADQYIGQMLAYAPPEADGSFWPASQVCNLIEELAVQKIESGIRTGCFNKRGVFRKNINEGGVQELNIAEQYAVWAERTVKFPRSSAMLLDISEMWKQHANQSDIRSEKNKLKI